MVNDIMNTALNSFLRDFPGGLVVKTLELPMQEAHVQSLLGELRSHMMLCGAKDTYIYMETVYATEGTAFKTVGKEGWYPGRLQTASTVSVMFYILN